MGGIVDAIGDAVDSVVDVVGDAVEWAADTVSNVVEHALDNPVETALMIGLTVATGGAGAAALGLEAPLTALEASVGASTVSGVSTLAQGGDLGDALKSAATTFAVAQGVSYAFDSFDATGATGEGATTTAFSDTGEVTQNFSDGSKLVTSPGGEVNPIPAPDLQGQVFDPSTLSWKPANEVNTDWLEAGIQPSGAETFPVADQATIQATDLPGLDSGATGSTATTGTTYDTMEDLLKDKGITYDTTVADAATNTGDTTGTDVNAGTTNQGTSTTDQGTGATDQGTGVTDQTTNTTGTGTTYDTMEDLLYDKGLITDSQYKDITGVAPVVDLSTPAGPAGDVSVLDAAKDLSGAVIDTIKDNPWTTAAVVGTGLAATGAGGTDTGTPTTSTPATKTYTYGPGAPINRTGLEELWSAASKIYGGDQGVMQQLGIQTPAATPFQSSFQPLLGGQAPGASVGLGALGQGFSYTPMGTGKTFDISTLSPEQIIQLQQAVARKKPGEGA